MSLLAFTGASLLILLTPGPTNTLLAAAGAAGGFRRNATLPLAESLGYGLAIGAYGALATALADNPAALAVLKLANIGWLCLTAARLWTRPPAGAEPARGSYGTVLLATLLNPKAMLVGVILIPAMMAQAPVAAMLAFTALSFLAGLTWVAVGANLPPVLKRHANRAAAAIVAAFAVIGAISLGQA